MQGFLSYRITLITSHQLHIGVATTSLSILQSHKFRFFHHSSYPTLNIHNKNYSLSSLLTNGERVGIVTESIRAIATPSHSSFLDPITELLIETIAHKIIDASCVTIITGAGISTGSGIPSFRDPESVWRGFSPFDLTSVDMLRDDLGLLWEFYEYRRAQYKDLQPNVAHYAVKELSDLLSKKAHVMGEEREGFSLITKNVDGLHQQAGSKDVLELCGSIWHVKLMTHANFLPEPGLVWENRGPLCETLRPATNPGSKTLKEWPKIPIEQLPHGFDPSLELSKNQEITDCIDPPLLRPAVTLFGESVDHRALNRVNLSVNLADVLLIIGTTSFIYPTTSFASMVRDNGGLVAYFNLQALKETLPLLEHTASKRWGVKEGVRYPEVYKGMEEDMSSGSHAENSNGGNMDTSSKLSNVGKVIKGEALGNTVAVASRTAGTTYGKGMTRPIITREFLCSKYARVSNVAHVIGDCTVTFPLLVDKVKGMLKEKYHI